MITHKPRIHSATGLANGRLLQLELTDTQDNLLHVEITEDAARELTVLFARIWGWSDLAGVGLEPEDLISLAARHRRESYPSDFSPGELADTLRGVLEALSEGHTHHAAGALATTIDVLDVLEHIQPDSH